MQNEMGSAINAMFTNNTGADIEGNSSNSGITISDDDGINGCHLNGNYIPEDVLIIILSHVEPKQLLNCKLVCKLWNRTIKSRALWHEICRSHNMQPKCLPWWLYYTKFATDFFDTNLIKNGNGQNKFDHWVIKPVFSGDGFLIENEPNGSQPLPENVDEFNGHKSCFATSFGLCSKHQTLRFKNSSLKKYILAKYKPTIVCSEWIAPRFDCSSKFHMLIKLVCTSHVKGSQRKSVPFHTTALCEQWTEGIWEKIELEIKDYPDDVDYIVYQHEGQDELFWKGHFGIKMAGACLKLLFDSIKEDPMDPVEESQD